MWGGLSHVEISLSLSLYLSVFLSLIRCVIFFIGFTPALLRFNGMRTSCIILFIRVLIFLIALSSSPSSSSFSSSSFFFFFCHFSLRWSSFCCCVNASTPPPPAPPAPPCLHLPDWWFHPPVNCLFSTVLDWLRFFQPSIKFHLWGWRQGVGEEEITNKQQIQLR